MSVIKSYFSEKDKECSGYYYFDAKHSEEFYMKNRVFPDQVSYSKEGALKRLRYINWIDKIGFIPSGNIHLPNLCHRRPYMWKHEQGFDHTTFWRDHGNRFPLFCLTEPYDLPNKEHTQTFELTRDQYKAKGRNLEFKVIEKSEKSLWVPCSTYMVFWWSPDYFDFESNQSILMSHEDASKFEKMCGIHINKDGVKQ